MEKIYEALKKISGSENVFANAPMREHTSFKAGGSADFLVSPNNTGELKQLIDLAVGEGINYYIMGNGTNLLVRDGGYRGIIIKILKGMAGISCDGCIIKAEAGALLSGVSKFAYEQGLRGMEFAEGIPGAIGGGAAMNAGAYGGELKEIIKSVTVLDKAGSLHSYSNEEMEFSYRNSLIQKEGLICLSVEIELEKGDKALILQKMNENKQARIDKQPIEKASAGSTFKRPKGHFTGKLVMDSGLRGFSLGGAQVSEKHCGFIINKGGASAGDIISLIEHVQKTVYGSYGVQLEPEVRIIGED